MDHNVDDYPSRLKNFKDFLAEHFGPMGLEIGELMCILKILKSTSSSAIKDVFVGKKLMFLRRSDIQVMEEVMDVCCFDGTDKKMKKMKMTASIFI